jgi:hypothetical protein
MHAKPPVDDIAYARPAIACDAWPDGVFVRSRISRGDELGGLPLARFRRDIQKETDMTLHIPESFSAWLVDWGLVTIMGNAMPPRDPYDDDDDDDEDEEDEKKKDDEPAVIREPDEDE